MFVKIFEKLKDINVTRKLMWWALFVVGAVGVVVMITNTYSSSDAEILAIGRRTVAWHERLIFPFYFTFISNVMGAVTGGLMLFCKKTKSQWMRRLQVFMVINLVVTFLVYWATLFPKHQPSSALAWVANMFVHLITPFIAVATFGVQTIRNKETIAYKNVWKEASWHMIFIAAWTVVALIIYFSLGATESGAVYHFLNIVHAPVWSTIIYIIAIPGAYYLLTVLAMWVSNPKTK